MAWFNLDVYGGGGGLTVSHSQMNKKKAFKKKNIPGGLRHDLSRAPVDFSVW